VFLQLCAQMVARSRDHGLEGLRRSGRKRAKTGALSRFDSLIAERALYWKRQHPKRGPTRILADMEVSFP
jgi:hypothetical protein